MLRFNTSTLLPLLFYLHPMFSRNAAESSFFFQKTPGIIVNKRTVSTSVELVPKVGFIIVKLKAGWHEQRKRKCKHKHKQAHVWTTTTQEMENFHFLSFTFTFHTRESGQRKDTRSMSLLFKFKPRWRQSLISFPDSSFPDCWSRVTRTQGTRLAASSWDTEMRVRNSFFRHLLLCLWL